MLKLKINIDEILERFEKPRGFKIYNEINYVTINYDNHNIKDALKLIINVLRMIKNDKHKKNLYDRDKDAIALNSLIENMPFDELRRKFKNILENIFIKMEVPVDFRKNINSLFEYIKSYKRSINGESLFEPFIVNNENNIKKIVRNFLSGNNKYYYRYK